MPKIVNHDERRFRISEQALSLFADQGYAALSMRSLAASIGVTTGMLYHYFPSKESLLSDAFRLVRTKDIEFVQQLILNEGEEASRGKHQLRAVSLLSVFISENSERLSGLLRIGLDVRRVDPDNSTLKETIRVYRDALRDIFGVNEVSAQGGLWLIFGCLTEVSLGGQVNSEALNHALSRLLIPSGQLA
jgi:AcrR family transcriptional regulator